MNFKNILSLFACLLVSNHFISQDSNQEIKSILIKDLIKTPKKLSKEEIKKKSSLRLKESSKQYGKSITKEELKELLYVFSSDEFEGRGTPSKGQDLATNFLKEKYKDLGIKPARKDSYEHKVLLQFDEKPNISLSINKRDFKYYMDYIAYNNGPDTSFNDTEIVYVGFGVDHRNYNSYDGLDVKG